MSDSSPPFDFERSWQERLLQAASKLTEADLNEQVAAAGQSLSQDSLVEERISWTCRALHSLENDLGPEALEAILSSCACRYPTDGLNAVRETFRQSGEIDLALAMLQAIFEDFLRNDLQLDENLITEITARGWGLAGERQGETIIATKIPKSGNVRAYFQESDPEVKRRLYCHCPRVREGVGREPHLPAVYCYCGAGFYQGIWQYILDRPVRVRLLESVMQGGDVCRVAVAFPPTPQGKGETDKAE